MKCLLFVHSYKLRSYMGHISKRTVSSSLSYWLNEETTHASKTFSLQERTFYECANKIFFVQKLQLFTTYLFTLTEIFKAHLICLSYTSLHRLLLITLTFFLCEIESKLMLF